MKPIPKSRQATLAVQQIHTAHTQILSHTHTHTNADRGYQMQLRFGIEDLRIENP